MKHEKYQVRKQATVNSKKRLCQVVDLLERRMLLSATLKLQLPSAALNSGGTTQVLDLGNYFDDSSIPSTDTVVEIETDLPSPYNLIPMELTTAATPNTVANFLTYIANGDYATTYISRSVPSFVLQGGGYNTSGGTIQPLGTIASEASTEVLNNSAGTIAMALSSGPNSATNQWFFNLVNNNGTSAPYDINLNNSSDGGPFTVFGQVIYQGMSVLNHIAGLPVVTDQATGNTTLPVQSGTNGASVASEPASNLVTTAPVIIPSGLVYTTNVSNSSVVTASISGDEMTLTPHAAGTASITVTAEDLGLGTTFDTFNVTVAGSAQLPSVYVDDASGTADVNSTINFPITLSNASSTAITLDYSVTAGTAPGTDFQAPASTLTIPAGATTATIPVAVVKDSTGLPETFTLNLSGIGSNAEFASLAATETATGTINPDDSIVPTVSIADASGVVGTGNQVIFPVTLSSPIDAATTLDYTLTAGTAASSDFQATAGSLTIPAGTSSASIPVNILNDSTSAAETFTITLSDLSSRDAFANGQSTESATGTITTRPTTTILSTASSVVAINGSETFTATAVDTATGAPLAGTVTFENAGIAIGSAALTSGVATLTANLSTAGDETFTALYSAQSIYAASASAMETVNVATLAPTVARSSVPTYVVAGTAAKGTATLSVINDTSTDENGNVTLDIYATTDGAIDSAAVLVGTVTRKVKVAAGKSVSEPLSVTSLTASLPSGNYELLAETINSARQISKSATGPVLTVATPDLTLSETFTRLVMPASVVAGSKTDVAAMLEITNRGNIASTGVTTIDLYASTDGTAANGTLITTLTSKVSIKPGKSASFSIPLRKYPLVANGSYQIVAEVTDPKKSVTSAVFPTAVTIAAAVVDVTGTIASVPATATIGKFVTITVDVTNNGNTTGAGTLDIAFAASASSTGENAVQLATLSEKIDIKPGQKIALHLKVPVPLGSSTGAQFLVATVDPDDAFNTDGVTSSPVFSATAISFG